METQDPGLPEKTKNALKKLVDQYVHHPEVSLIDAGLDPGQGAQLVLRVHVRQPSAESSLNLPAEVDGIPVRVVQGDYELEEKAMDLSKTTKNNNVKTDDLQKIKGIGKSIADTLKSVGIMRYADLAKLDEESLAELLKGKLTPLTLQRARRDEWIRQAKELAGQQEPASDFEQVESETEFEAAGIDLPDFIKQTERGGWREIADFFLSFGYEIGPDGEERLMTKAHHSQADKYQEWEGIASIELFHWIFEQADLEPPTLASASLTKMEAIETENLEQETREGVTNQEEIEENVHLELLNLWVSEVKAPVVAGGRQQGSILRVESDLVLSGTSAYDLTENRLEYYIELYLVNLENNQSQMIESYPDRLSPGKLTYKIRKDLPFPEVGQYQLYVVARLLPPAAAAVHLQGPMIYVEP